MSSLLFLQYLRKPEYGFANGQLRYASLAGVVTKDITGNTHSCYFSAYPLDGTDYNANTQFGNGDDLGDGTFIVYNGTGTNVTVTNLDNTKQYAIRVYEYTKNSNNGNNALYLLGNAAEREAFLSIEENSLSEVVQVYPTITSEILNINNLLPESLNFTIFDLQGRNLQKGKLTAGENQLDVSAIQAGLYLIDISINNKRMVVRFIKK